MDTPTTTTAAVGLQRLVRQIARALKATNRLMFWDLSVEEGDIVERLTRVLADSYTEREAMESVIEGVIMSHENFLGDAVNDQCRQATRVALAKLPNDQAERP